ncbi:MAG: hypothetical protein OEY49_18590, partial [Candidatus Heimdallarchaeota archaeon]|nr:hypothetical protein [Candidatus Heimdallarchaeota archaeon]
TIVIFATSFQFSGLIYMRTNSFPKLLGNFTLLDASVIFMIVTGGIWMTFLLGIDILERTDIQIIDIDRSKLTNIGEVFRQTSHKGLNFLTLSFLIIAIQDFQPNDWVQTIFFLDLFFLLAVWILLSYESDIELIANTSRVNIDKRTIGGAERKIIKDEKRRFGEEKIREAEEQMILADKKIKTAEEVTFTKLVIQALLTNWAVIFLTAIIIYLYTILSTEISFTQLLFIEILSIFTLVFIMFMIRETLAKDDIVRDELIWFPLLILGNIVVSYTMTTYVIDLYHDGLYIIILFLFLWFYLIYKNIFDRAASQEFWNIFQKIMFFIAMIVIWISTIFFQNLLESYYGV